MPVKPRPAIKIGRKRRLVGWTLLTFGVMTGAFWVASGWWRFVRMGEFSGMYLDNGRVNYSSFIRATDPDNRGWESIPLEEGEREGWGSRGLSLVAEDLADSGWPQHYLLLVTWTHEPGRIVQASVAWWPLPVGFLVVGSGLVIRARRARRIAEHNLCPTCGYSLTGLGAEAKCPECGKNAVTP